MPQIQGQAHGKAVACRIRNVGATNAARPHISKEYSLQNCVQPTPNDGTAPALAAHAACRERLEDKCALSGPWVHAASLRPRPSCLPGFGAYLGVNGAPVPPPSLARRVEHEGRSAPPRHSGLRMFTSRRKITPQLAGLSPQAAFLYPSHWASYSPSHPVWLPAWPLVWPPIYPRAFS